MADRFRHLKDSAFPDVSTVDVYKYANEFDYSRFDAAQMSLQLCNVPWDMGEAHIGNRTISGIGNVVFFETKAKRDKWFSDIPNTECYRFETKFKELHRTNEIDVPIPFDVASKYNYLVVRYNLFANDDSLVSFEDATGLREWFWFVREVEFIAPNSTKLHLLNDAWQTFIYDLDVSGMVLERGHAPMVSIDAAGYLKNPIANCANLLHPDIVNENAGYIGSEAGELVFNDGESVYAVVITTANPKGTWGTKAAETWNTPALSTNNQDGSIAYTAFAMKASDIVAFLGNINASSPQFLQTIKAICFINSDMLDLGTAFTFGNKTCYPVATDYVSSEVLELDADAFGYPSEYADIAKLYTYPYSYIELSDGMGYETQIRIETTTGTVDFVSRLNLVMPFVKISGHVNSTGNGNGSSVTFGNITAHTFDFKGNWYKHLMEWDIPTFGVVQSSADNYDYASYFEREQAETALTNSYNSNVASADTAKANAYESAETAKSNAYANAATTKTNADNNAKATYDNAYDSADNTKANAYLSADTAYNNAVNTAVASHANSYNSAQGTRDIASLQTATNTANVTENNSLLSTQNSTDQVLNGAMTLEANLMVNGSTNNQIAATDRQAALAASTSAVTGAVSAITSAVSGNIGGAIGAIVNAGASAASSIANASISNDLTTAQAGLQTNYNSACNTGNNAAGYAKMTAQQTNATNINTNTNDLITDSADVSADVTETNADITLDNVIGNGSTWQGTAFNNKQTAETIADNDLATTKGNADRTYWNVVGHGSDIGTSQRSKDTAETIADDTETAAKDNADRNYTTSSANATRAKDTAEQAIANGIKQAALGAPFEYGMISSADYANTKPIGLFASIVTQDPYSIAYTGDYFLRYGYAYNRQWVFDGDWNIDGCSKFCYWKLSDFWVDNLSIPDMYVDKIRFFLYGGVTVWRKPEDIGNTSVYDNIDWSLA